MNYEMIGFHIHQIVVVTDAAGVAVSVADVEYDVDAAAAVAVAAGDGDDEQDLQVPWGAVHGYNVQAWTAQPACLSPGQ